MKYIVDTNVAIVANGESTQASTNCAHRCVGTLLGLMQHHILLLDDGWHILGEYGRNLDPKGKRGPGNAFYKWVLRNQRNPHHCQLVTITPTTTDFRPTFTEFPDDPALVAFDPSDHKFVAVAVAYERVFDEKPSILNAVDTDWWEHRHALGAHGILIEFLCPEAMT